MKALSLSLLVVVLAPYQFCASNDAKPPMEDTAPKALWMLADKLEKEGDHTAHDVALQQLIQEYPSSRYAWRARNALGLADPEGASAEAVPDQEKGEVESPAAAPASGATSSGGEKELEAHGSVDEQDDTAAE